MTGISSTRKIYDDVFYRIEAKHNISCAHCKTYLPMSTDAYAKGSATGNEVYCKECTAVLSSRYQFEQFSRIPYPKEEPLYIMIGHACSQLLADYEFRTAIFRRNNRAAYLLVRYCPQCNRCFLDLQDYQNNTHILHDYTLIHTATNKPIPSSRQSYPNAESHRKEQEKIHPFVVWSYQHPNQGGGCSGK